MNRLLLQVTFVFVVSSFSAAQAITTDAIPVIPGVEVTFSGDRSQVRIAKEVRHELAMLPRYGLFDDLRFRVKGDTVELLGDVAHATLKSDAEHAVKGVEGVERVVNNINVLSPSPSDDRLRLAVARAVSESDGLSRYFWEAAPSIHIIVNASRVTLTGVVDNAGDSQRAYVAASGVPGTLGVTNKLLVSGGGK